MNINDKDFNDKCLVEYAKDSKLKKEHVYSIKSWLIKTPNLPNIHDFFIIQFYKRSNYSIQRAKELIDAHYSYRNEVPELFSGRGYGAPNFSHTFWDITHVFEIPAYVTEKGYRVVYFGFSDKSSSKFDLENSLAMTLKILLALICENGFCRGYIFVMNGEGFSIGHLRSITIPLLMKIIHIVEHAPFKLSQLNVINVNSSVDAVLKMLKALLPNDLISKIKFHADMDNLFKQIPKEKVPCDIGGTLHSTCQQLSVIELKDKDFKPEYAGKMNFYLSAVDDLLKHETDQPKKQKKQLKDS